MRDLIEGDVVIVKTTQAGTVIAVFGGDVMVLLGNGEIWMGHGHSCFLADAELANAAPLEVDRFEGREKPLPPRPNQKMSRREDYND